ncbi:MAG: ABC transporter permease [Ignavibacteriota bacterium]
MASLGQPLLYLLGLGFGLGPIFQKAGQGNYLQFVAPGIIGMTILFSSIFSGAGLIFDRQFGFLKETLVAPVPRIYIMLGRTLGAATVAVLQSLLVAVVCVLCGFRPVDYRTLPLHCCSWRSSPRCSPRSAQRSDLRSRTFRVSK